MFSELKILKLVFINGAIYYTGITGLLLHGKGLVIQHPDVNMKGFLWFVPPPLLEISSLPLPLAKSDSSSLGLLLQAAPFPVTRPVCPGQCVFALLTLPHGHIAIPVHLFIPNKTKCPSRAGPGLTPVGNPNARQKWMPWTCVHELQKQQKHIHL